MLPGSSSPPGFVSSPIMTTLFWCHEHHRRLNAQLPHKHTLTHTQTHTGLLPIAAKSRLMCVCESVPDLVYSFIKPECPVCWCASPHVLLSICAQFNTFLCVCVCVCLCVCERQWKSWPRQWKMCEPETMTLAESRRTNYFLKIYSTLWLNPLSSRPSCSFSLSFFGSTLRLFNSLWLQP